MDSKQIRIGIVGLGEHMGRAHIKHLVVMPNVTITRWFDPNDNADTSYFNSLNEKPIRSSFEEICEDKNIDAVFIGSPDKYHADQLLSCVEFNKHVFCEKPMAVTVEDVSKLKEALFIARKFNLVISSCHPRRFDPPFVWLKRKLDDTEWVSENFGKITDFNFDFWYHEVTEEWKKDRSLLKDHFGHEIDIYRFLFGTTKGFESDMIFDGYDQYQVIGSSNREDLPDFLFTGYRSLKEQVYQETVTIKGTKNAFVMQLNKGVGMWLKDGGPLVFPRIRYDLRFELVNKDFISAIEKREVPYLTHEDMIENNVSGVMLCGPEETYRSE